MAALLLPALALASDATSAVEAFVGRLAGAPVTDLAIEQSFTLYHPDGRHPQSTGEQRVWLDAEHGVVRFIRRERLPKGEAMVDLAFSEHRPLSNGFSFPYRQEAFVDGKLLLLVVVRTVTLNGSVPDDLFDPDALRRTR